MSLFPNYGTQLVQQTLIDDANLAEQKRRQLMARACMAYQGEDPQINQPLKTAAGEPDDNVAINYSETIVDKGTSFLFGPTTKISVGDAQNQNPEADRYLERVWPEDVRTEDLIELATNGGIFGHVWAKITVVNNVPRVVVGDPECYTAEWAADDYKQVLQYFNTWRTTDAGRPVLRRERTYQVSVAPGQIHWQIQLEQRTLDAPTWLPIGSPHDWPFPFAPVVHCKNLPTPNQFYGRPDLTLPVLQLMYYINRTKSLIARIVRRHASPKPYATGVTKQQLEVGTDKMLFLPHHEAKLQLLEMEGDLEQARNFAKDLREALAEVTHVPEVTTGKTENVGQLSGRAMRILYGPLIDQTVKKRTPYGRLLKQLVGNLLVIGQLAPAIADANGGQNVKVNVQWGDPLPADEKEQAEVAVMKKQFGYSNDTLIKQTGGDPEVERKQRKADAKEAAAALMSQVDGGGAGLPGGDVTDDEDQ